MRHRGSLLPALALTVALAAARAPDAWAQRPAETRQIAGTVTRPNNSPLADVTVQVTGSAVVTKTGANGRFTIQAAGGDVVLELRAIGFAPRRVPVPADRAQITVALDELPFKLGELTVSGQGTTLSRRDATTAPAVVDAEEIRRAPGQSIEQALQGKVLGASINMNNGAPGGGGQIQIRGVSSILGSGEPLFVIDGVISSNDARSNGSASVTRGQDNNVNRLADLNPAEIESIEVLKDAAATAIYGSRASNGVVVIRTKRGTPGRGRFTVTQRLGVAEPAKRLGYREYSSVAEVIATRFGQANNAAAIAYLNAHFPDGTIPVSANINLERAFFDNRSLAYETNVAASGGSEQTRYFVSLTNRKEPGLAPNNDAQLQSARVNVDQTWNARWTTSVSLNVTRNLLNRGLANNDNTNTSPVYNFAYTPAVFDLREHDAAGQYVRNPTFGGGFNTSNPFETYQYLKLTTDVFRQIGSANVTWTPITTAVHRVALSVQGGIDRYEQSGQLYSPPFLQYEGRDGFFGRSQQSTVDGYNRNVQGFATWTVRPAGDLSVTTTAGGSIEQQSINEYTLLGRGLLPGTETAGQGNVTTTQTRTEFADQALFASGQVQAFRDRLTLNGGVRADRSSANGDQAKYYLFPRVSGAYRFERPIGAIDELKVRGGWGQSGNRPRYADRYVLLGSGPILGGQPTIVNPTVVGNPDIRPETLSELTGGIDLTALDQRLFLEATYYARNIDDLLLQPVTAPTSGFSNLVVNAGRLRNRGVELALTAVPLRSTDFTVTSRATFQRSRQRVVNLPADVPPFSPAGNFGASFGRNRITEGALTTAIWGNVPVDAAGNILPVGAYALTPGLVAGRVDTLIGDANPEFQMFFNTTVQWKRFSLAATVDWRKGGDVANTTTKLYDEGGTSRDYTAAITADNLPRGVPADVIGALPSPMLGLGDFRYRAWSGGSDARVYLQDGSYVRVRDIQLTYDVPASAARLLGASSLRVSLQARNPFLFTSYWGYDPEFNNYGNQNVNRFIDTAPYPSVRSFHVAIDAAF